MKSILFLSAFAVAACCFSHYGDSTSLSAFIATGDMTTGRAQPVLTVLNNGKVLITGGSLDRPASAEIYTASSKTFSATCNMTRARSSHTATLLKNGKVLLAGGLDSQGIATSSAELYDPTTGAFTAIGNMTIDRARHTATLLSDGRVLIAGGRFERPATAEIYDPATGIFTATGNMITGRLRTRPLCFRTDKFDCRRLIPPLYSVARSYMTPSPELSRRPAS